MKYFLSTVVAFLIVPYSFAKFNIPETPFSVYTFPAQECKIIQHHQSRILVPAYTFYLDGKLYEGAVNLKYREFTDQLDIILNHIPMSYAEHDRQHMLESGGMFELYAYGNGKLLSFAPGKRISVQLASNFDMAGGETFVFDRNSKSWKKDTPFGNDPQSNQVLSDNKQDLWGDNIWENSDNWQNSDLSLVADPNGQLSQVVVRSRAFKTINIDKMEMYNCDRILKEDAVPLVADFKLEGYSQKLNSEIYVVYKKRNAVITYYPEQFASGFKLLPDEDFTIFTYSKDGKIAVLDAQFTNGFDVRAYAGKKVVFPMKVFPDLPGTKQELAAMTGL